MEHVNQHAPSQVDPTSPERSGGVAHAAARSLGAERPGRAPDPVSAVHLSPAQILEAIERASTLSSRAGEASTTDRQGPTHYAFERILIGVDPLEGGGERISASPLARADRAEADRVPLVSRALRRDDVAVRAEQGRWLLLAPASPSLDVEARAAKASATTPLGAGPGGRPSLSVRERLLHRGIELDESELLEPQRAAGRRARTHGVSPLADAAPMVALSGAPAAHEQPNDPELLGDPSRVRAPRGAERQPVTSSRRAQPAGRGRAAPLRRALRRVGSAPPAMRAHRSAALRRQAPGARPSVERLADRAAHTRSDLSGSRRTGAGTRERSLLGSAAQVRAGWDRSGPAGLGWPGSQHRGAGPAGAGGASPVLDHLGLGPVESGRGVFGRGAAEAVGEPTLLDRPGAGEQPSVGASEHTGERGRAQLPTTDRTERLQQPPGVRAIALRGAGSSSAGAGRNAAGAADQGRLLERTQRRLSGPERGSASADLEGRVERLLGVLSSSEPGEIAHTITERARVLGEASRGLPRSSQDLVQRLIRVAGQSHSRGRSKVSTRTLSSARRSSTTQSRRGSPQRSVVEATGPVPEASGSGRVTKLANKLMKLIHLAESERRVAEAQRQVRLSEESTEAQSTLGAGQPGEADSVNIKALRQDVLDAVLREIEKMQWRREDQDGPNIWC